MWIVEKYVKYLIGFAILWGGLYLYRSCGCAKVQGTAMSPSYLSDDFLVIWIGKNRPENNGGTVKSQDVIWFRYQVPNAREDGYIGRVIGLPGDKVAISKGVVLIRGKELAESNYAKPESALLSQSIPEIVVPRGTYYVLCDNRREPNAPDSRRFGPIPVNAVVGKVKPK